MLLKSIAPQGTPNAQQLLGQLQDSVPLGWSNGTLANLYKDWNWLYVIPGWLISAIATLFGAPFWFDTLQKFVRLRGTGPDEKGST
jgi:hypothetical protein